MGRRHLHLQSGTVCHADRRHASNYHLLGRRLFEQGAIEGARTQLQRALACDPTHQPTLRSLADLEFAQQHPEIARAYLARILAVAPHDPDIHFMLGYHALSEGNYTGALDALERAREFGDHSPELLYNLGLAHFFLRKGAQAVETFTRLTDDYATHARGWDALGCARHLVRDLDGALHAFLKALQLDDTLNDCRDHLAQLLLDMKNPHHAQRILQAALALEPERPSSLHLLGIAFAADQDLLEATRCWETLIARGQGSFETYLLLANTLRQLGERAAALDTLHALVAQFPEQVLGHVQLALLLLECGEKETGRRHLEQARALDPQHPAVIHAWATAQTLFQR